MIWGHPYFSPWGCAKESGSHRKNSSSSGISLSEKTTGDSFPLVDAVARYGALFLASGWFVLRQKKWTEKSLEQRTRGTTRAKNSTVNKKGCEKTYGISRWKKKNIITFMTIIVIMPSRIQPELHSREIHDAPSCWW